MVVFLRLLLVAVVVFSSCCNIAVSALQIPFFSSAVANPSTTTRPPPRVLQDSKQIKALQEVSEEQARAKHDNDVFNALFVEVPERPEPVPYTAQPPLPPDFPPGCLLRIGPMGASSKEGFLDGDGLIHCMTFPPFDGTGTYSSTYVDTEGRKREQQFGNEKKYMGSLGAAPFGYPLLSTLVRNMVAFQTLKGQKDTCNTAIAEHGGRLLALMEQCPPSEIQIGKDGTLKTIESGSRLDGALPYTDPLTGGGLSAHGRTCPITNDRIHVTYNSAVKPFVRVDTFGTGWNLRNSVGVDTPAPIMVHDCAITPNYTVLFDFPLTVRPIRMLWNRFPVEYEPDHGARIGLVPRSGEGEPLWFNCEPGVILHSVNAHETEDGKVVVHGLRSEPKQSSSFLSQYATSFLHEWTLDLKSGECSEQCLNPNDIVEFPVICDQHHGMEHVDSVYCVSVSTIGGPLLVNKMPEQGILLDGVKKLALKDSDKANKGNVIGQYVLSQDWYSVSEPTVVSKKGRDGEYVLIIATHVPEGTSWTSTTDLKKLKSQIHLLDGDDLEAGPVWMVDLPHHVPYGLHSSFVKWDTLS